MDERVFFKPIATNAVSNQCLQKTFDCTYELIDQSVSEGIDPYLFGPLVEQIITSSSVQRLYRVSKPVEKFSVLLKRILPTPVYERMIRTHYEM